MDIAADLHTRHAPFGRAADGNNLRRERGEVSRHEFNRYWAQVVLQPGGRGRQALLALRSHGRQVEFGRHLTEEQRCRMAGIIRAELGNR